MDHSSPLIFSDEKDKYANHNSASFSSTPAEHIQNDAPVPQWGLTQQFDYCYAPTSLFNLKTVSLESDLLRIQNKIQSEKPYSDFLQLIRLSQDGKSLLSVSDYQQLNIYTFSDDCYQTSKYYLAQVTREGENNVKSEPFTPLTAEHSIGFGEPIYDIRFYPNTSNQTETNTSINPFVMFAMKDHPIHFYNLSSQQIISSYFPRNHLDELPNVYSLNFNSSYDKLIAGTNSYLYIFDIQNPHVVLSSFSTNKENSFSKPSPFHTKGIISCIESNPDYSGILAVSTLSSDISLYDERLMGSSSSSLKESLLFTVKNQSSTGIIQLKWSSDGNYLFVNCRKHDFIYVYDIRNQKKCIGKFYRHASENNQKMIMDLDPWNNYLITGNQFREEIIEKSSSDSESDITTNDPILVYDIKTFQLVNSFNPYKNNKNDSTVHTTLFHPYYSILITATGERVFPAFENEDDDSDEDETTDDEEEIPTTTITEGTRKKRKRENETIPTASKPTVVEKETTRKSSLLSIWSLPKKQLYFEEQQQMDQVPVTNEQPTTTTTEKEEGEL
jgi:hypothetical protein